MMAAVHHGKDHIRQLVCYCCRTTQPWWFSTSRSCDTDDGVYSRKTLTARALNFLRETSDLGSQFPTSPDSFHSV